MPGGPATARDTVSIDIMKLEEARGTPVFTRGLLQEYDLSASGGSNLFTYFAGVGMEDTEGVEPTSTVERYSGRLNVSVVPNTKLNLAVNMGYMHGETHLPCEAGCGGRALGTMWANALHIQPLADGSPNPRRGFNSALPEMYDEQVKIWQGVDRFTGGIQLSHTPLTWLRHRISAGTDRVTEDDNWLEARSADSLTNVFFGDGYRAVRNRQVNNYTLDYSASAEADVLTDFRSTTSFGAQYYRNTANYVYSEGSTFPTVGLTALAATTTDFAMDGDLSADATLGFYLQEQVGWRDRLFVTAAIRADDNSAFGQNFDRVYYPKYSASWVISEEPFWQLPAISALKLRAAYGESGKQPATYSALQTYTAASGPGDVAAVTPQSGTPIAVGRLEPANGTVRAGEVFPIKYTLDVARRNFAQLVSNP